MNADSLVTLLGGLGLFLLGILVRLCHALGIISRGFHDDLTRIPATAGIGDPRRLRRGRAGARVMASRHERSRGGARSGRLQGTEGASTQLQRRMQRRAARRRWKMSPCSAPTATARAVLETLAWADGTLYHAWRLAESLRAASGNEPSARESVSGLQPHA